ncbi:glycyl radical enzyme [Spirochaetia bacterium]|nr:glycyl radical enzyme [Spirochaetia bacterium]
MSEEVLSLLEDDVQFRPRIKKLREEFFNHVPSVCVQRARLISKSHQETEGKPMLVRRALALEKILKEIDVYLLDGELLVGALSETPRGASVFPEFAVNWIKNELEGKPVSFGGRTGDPYTVTDEVKKELLEDIIPYWHGKTHEDRVKSLMPEESWRAGMEVKGFDDAWLTISGDGHTIPDYIKVIRLGVAAIIKEVEDRVASLDLLEPDNLFKLPFYESVLISLKALVSYAKRLSVLAADKAKSENDPLRKKELEEISRICAKVPEQPAETFHEALQSLLFVNIGIQMESNGHSISFGRVDQFLFPFYQKAIKEGGLTPEDVLELLNCFWIKLNSFSKLRDIDNTKFFVGNPLFQNLTIGGQTSDGRDAVNDLSYLCLCSTKKLRMVQPSLVVRYYNGISDRFLAECAKVIRTGLGMPAMFSDEAIIPSMLNIGYTMEDAVDYGIVGCVEPAPQGKIGGRYGAAFPSPVKMLEIALNGGLDPRTGIHCTGGKKLVECNSFEEVMAEFKKQMDYFLKHHVIFDNIIDISYRDMTPTPLLSSLIEGCIERGLEIKEGGAKYDFTGGQIVGLTCAANGLAALKTLVFDNKTFTKEQFAHALETNYEDDKTSPTGQEIRLYALNRSPKFGNNDETADSIAAEITRYWATEKMKMKNTRYGKGPIGGRFIPSTATVSANVPSGYVIGATPDGRKKGDPVSEGISAYRGTDCQGPTALINSLGRIPNTLMPGGQLLNVKLNPATLQGSKGIANMVALMRTLFDAKGMHVQFNVVDKKILEDALQNSDKYQDLVIRVAGYSAYFVTLDKDVQTDIMQRTEHNFA